MRRATQPRVDEHGQYRGVQRIERQLLPERDSCDGLQSPDHHAVPSRRRHAGRELGGTIEVLPPPYTQPDPTPFLQITNIGRHGVAAGHLRHRPRSRISPPTTTIYVFYTLGTPNHDRLSRFTANATLTGTVAGSELVLYEDPRDARRRAPRWRDHVRQRRQALPHDRRQFNAAAAQDLTNPHGKILRFNPDGTVPTDNPFYDGAGPNFDAIWALGLRNPFRAYYDAPTGRLFIGDVGGNDYSTAIEEINIGVARRQLRLAQRRRAEQQSRLHEPRLLLSPQRTRRGGHGRVRLSRHSVPEQLPGQLLLRRLRAELDQAPDVRRQRQRHRRLQFRARRRIGRRTLRRHRVPDRGSRRRALLRRPRLLGHQRHSSASARSAASAT